MRLEERVHAPGETRASVNRKPRIDAHGPPISHSNDETLLARGEQAAATILKGLFSQEETEETEKTSHAALRFCLLRSLL